MKKWIVISCALLLGIGVLILFIVSNTQKDNSIMKIAFYPTGTSKESYYFILDQDGTLNCAVGSRKSDDIKQRHFLKITESSSKKKLSSIDLHALKDMANELQIKGSPEKVLQYDSWVVALLYNGKVYEMDYWDNNDSTEFMNLTNKIIELSPIPVDLHGWA